jgi:hypothetical protein
VGCVDTNAIEGGGRHKLSGIITDIDVDGDPLVVGRTSFTTTGASIVIDGRPASLENLHKGEIVTVTGTIDATQQTGCAKAVFADASLIGQVQSIDLASQTLLVLYQTISVRADTVWASADGSPLDLATVRRGDKVRISGVASDGVIVATRIDGVAAGEGYFVSGAIDEIDERNHLFSINGIKVFYATSSIVGFPGDQLHVGDPVRVVGTEFQSHPWYDDITYLRPTEVAYIDYDASLSVSPSTAAVEVNGSVQFHAYTTDEQGVTWSVLDSNGEPCSVDDCGAIDSTGLYYAPLVVHVAPPLLVRATSVTDADSSVTVSVVVYASPLTLGLIPAVATVAAGDSRNFSTYNARNPVSDFPVIWSVAGEGCSGAACGTVDADGRYHAPVSLPVPAVVTVTARRVKNPTVFGSATVVLGPNPNDARLQGRYAFSLTGFEGTGYVTAIGSVVVNGAGRVIDGIEYVNSAEGLFRQASITGSYAIDADHRGFMQLDVPARGAGTLSLALADVVGGVARTVRVTSHFAGRVLIGTMRRQNEGDFSADSVAGHFAFGLEGLHNIAAAGRFTIVAGELTDGQVDMAIPDVGDDMLPPRAITGAVQPGIDANGEARLDVSIESVPEVAHFVAFVVSAGEVLLMQADLMSVSRDLTGLSGTMLHQQGGPFDMQALVGETVMCLAGRGFAPSIERSTYTADGHVQSDSLTWDDYAGISVDEYGGTYVVAPNGRVAANFDVTKRRMYLVGPGKAFAIDWGTRAGMLYARQPTSTTLTGRYALASLPSTKWPMSGTSAVLTASADGTVVGKLDGDTSARRVTGSYLLNDDGELQLSLAREDAMPTQSRYLMASDDFGLGISTSETGYEDDCMVLQR